MADGVYVADAMPGLPGPTVEADQPCGDREVYFDSRVRIASNRACFAAGPELEFLRTGSSTGRTCGGGNPQSPGVPLRGGSRLSESRTVLCHTFGRRGATDPAGHANWFQASGCAVRSG